MTYEQKDDSHGSIKSMSVEEGVVRPFGSAVEIADGQIRTTKATNQELEQILKDVFKQHPIPAPDHVSWASKEEQAERQSRWPGQVTNLKAEDEIIPPGRSNNMPTANMAKSYGNPIATPSGMLARERLSFETLHKYAPDKPKTASWLAAAVLGGIGAVVGLVLLENVAGLFLGGLLGVMTAAGFAAYSQQKHSG